MNVVKIQFNIIIAHIIGNKISALELNPYIKYYICATTFNWGNVTITYCLYPLNWAQGFPVRYLKKTKYEDLFNLQNKVIRSHDFTLHVNDSLLEDTSHWSTFQQSSQWGLIFAVTHNLDNSKTSCAKILLYLKFNIACITRLWV